MRLCIFCVMIAMAGCAVNVVEVCDDEGHCATGWYNESGNLITTEHGFDKDELLHAISPTGYEARGLSRMGTIAPDVVVYKTDGSYKPRVCYADVDPGDYVTISTLSGIGRTTIRSKGDSVYYIDDVHLRAGDSGSPVTSWGCIVGVVRAKTKKGTLVVAVRHE